MTSLSTITLWIITIAIIISFIVIMAKGFNNQLVIYYDNKDLLRVTLTIISFCFSVFLLDEVFDDSLEKDVLVTWLVTPAFCLITLILAIDNFILSIRHNNNQVFIGVLIAIYRYFYLLMALLIILKLMPGSDDKKRSSGDIIFSLLGISTVSYGFYRLVNGDKVKAMRKRQLKDLSTD